MLYDILPPVFLFLSLSGLIIMLSRVMLRMRRQHSPAVAAASYRSDDINVDEDQIFKPEKRGVDVFKNRLSYLPHVLKQTVAQTAGFVKDRRQSLTQSRQERRLKKQEQQKAAESDYPVAETPESDQDTDEKSIVMPKSAWRERFSVMKSAKGLGTSLVSKAQKIQEQRAVKKEQPQTEAITMAEEAASPKDDQKSISQAEDTQAQPPSPAPAKRKLRLRRTGSSETGQASSASRSVRKNIARLRPTRPSISSAQDGGVSILDQASEAIAATQYHQAEDILLPYIIKHSRDSKAYMLLGQTAVGQRDWSEAIEIFQQVLKLNPAEPGANAALGHAALKAGRFTLALESLQRAHDQEPENLEVLKQLLRIAQRMDNSVLKRSVSEKITTIHAARLAQEKQQ